MSEESTKQAGNKRKDPPLSISGEEAEEEVAPLGWRMDPEESYSDWKIEITVGDAIHMTYNVHRSTLAVGPRRSEYFVRLFSNKSLKEHETHTSCIEMEELAAHSFPLMLDYMYNLWEDVKKPIAVENAVALHYFGRYFEIRGLQKEARTFWEKNMTIDQAGTYLEHAMIFHDDHAHDAVAEKCASSIGSIEVNSRLMELSDVKFWLAVLRANKNERSPTLSTLISSFCSAHQEHVDSDTFLQLTGKSELPELSEAAAMELLQLEQVFVPPSVGATELSSLQERALDALTCNTGPLDLSELQRSFNDFPSIVLLQMLQRSIANSRESNKRRQSVQKENGITVSGAGTDAVNGIYSLAAQHRNGFPYYVMEGNWKGSPARFELYKFVDSWWYISILRQTVPSGADNDFYAHDASKSTDNCLLPPPKTGWCCADGAAPPPSLSLNF